MPSALQKSVNYQLFAIFAYKKRLRMTTNSGLKVENLVIKLARKNLLTGDVVPGNLFNIDREMKEINMEQLGVLYIFISFLYLI